MSPARLGPPIYPAGATATRLHQPFQEYCSGNGAVWETARAVLTVATLSLACFLDLEMSVSSSLNVEETSDRYGKGGGREVAHFVERDNS